MTQWEGVGKWFHCSSAPVLSVDSHGSRQVNFVEIYQRWLLWKFIWKLKIYEGGFRENIWIWLVKPHQGAFCGKFLGFQRNEFSGVYRQVLKKEHDDFFYWINPKMVQTRTSSLFCEQLSFTIEGLLARIWCLKVLPPEQMCPQLVFLQQPIWSQRVSIIVFENHFGVAACVLKCHSIIIKVIKRKLKAHALYLCVSSIAAGFVSHSGN